MSPAAMSVLAFGVYLAGGGVALVFFPGQSCELIGLPRDEGLWIRLTGMFFLLFANYCLRAAREEATAFMRWTVLARPFTLVFLGALALLGLAPPHLLLFGVLDVAASLWTARALRAT